MISQVLDDMLIAKARWSVHILLDSRRLFGIVKLPKALMDLRKLMHFAFHPHNAGNGGCSSMSHRFAVSCNVLRRDKSRSDGAASSIDPG